MKPVLDYSLMVAPNGARRTTADHPALPVTSADLARTALACQIEGATAIHIHVRDEDQRHSLDPGRYREAIDAISELAPTLGLQITTESAGMYTPTDQLACLQALRPIAASVAVREMIADPLVARRTYAFAEDEGIEIQHIVYTPACIAQLLAGRNSGLVRSSQCQVLLVLGQYLPPCDATPRDMELLISALQQGDRPVDWQISVCAFGSLEHRCLVFAAARGFGVRLGFENSLSGDDGRLHADNAASVRAFLKASDPR